MKKIFAILLLFSMLMPSFAMAQIGFNPNFIISDTEMYDYNCWGKNEVQTFLDSRGSYLRNLTTTNINEETKQASDIIYKAAQTYQVNPKYILVTLQKEQSLITDDSPTQKQLDWAAGYAVCDSCSMSDPKIQKYKGFGKQVDATASAMKWYSDNRDKAYIKKKDVPTTIDNENVTPQSWATAFLYTYTPHLNGNKNFWRIWQTWFAQNYPNGTLVKTETSPDVWLIQNNKKRKFKNQTVLITRADPNMIVAINETDLSNYEQGPDITLPNYSIIKTPNGKYYLIDYDYIRPFESADTVKQLGYHPDETIEVSDAEIASYTLGPIITASTKAPQGIIYEITDMSNAYYLLKDGNFYPITDKNIVAINYKNLPIEKHKRVDLSTYPIIYSTPSIRDGALLKDEETGALYVVENSKKRQIMDTETFYALGYKAENLTMLNTKTLMLMDDGEKLYMNSSLLSSKEKFLGDLDTPVEDLFKSKLPAYLIAEYPSGRILSGKNIDTKRQMASMVKIITALEAVNQNFKSDKTVTYSKKAHGTTGNSIYFAEGDKFYLKDAFNSMLIGSYNNSAKIMAQSTGLSEANFVKAMNTSLDAWGADDTDVADVTGLDAKNISTARNLLKIFVKATKNEKINAAFSQVNYTFKEISSKDSSKSHSMKNTNKLIDKPGRNYRILASNAGYTKESGANLAMLIENRKDKTQQYVIITLGGPTSASTRFDEPHRMAEWILKTKINLAVK